MAKTQIIQIEELKKYKTECVNKSCPKFSMTKDERDDFCDANMCMFFYIPETRISMLTKEMFTEHSWRASTNTTTQKRFAVLSVTVA